MKKLTVAGIMVLVSLILASNVFAAAFINPPEIYAPVWGTAYPYQRNILWDFASDPTITDPVYAGYDDALLSCSDYVTISGAVSWFNTLPGFSTSRTGFIGIDNRAGFSSLTGQVVFHLDNHINTQGYYKHVWKEIEFYEHDLIAPISSIEEIMGLPIGYNINAAQEVLIAALPEQFKRYNVWYEIEPNPEWENIIFNFEVAPGTFAVIDKLHIATECIPIPEPATMILLGSLATGLFSVAGIRKKI